jgi:hypothetical protein
MRWETGQDKVLGEDQAEEHHFVPWRISAHDGDSDDFVMKTLHWNPMLVAVQVSVLAAQRAPQAETVDVALTPVAAHVKFSVCPPRLDEKTLDGATRHGDTHSTRRRVGQHDLNLVNLFTTTLCEECRLPLWGGTAQTRQVEEDKR